MIKLLDKLTGLHGVSGNEDRVREYIASQIRPYADRIAIDSMGNLLAFKKGRGRAPLHIMLSAHMDEVGLIIKSIADNGMLYFGNVGGIDRRVIIGRRVLIGEKGVPGVVGIRAVHMMDKDERETVPKIEDMYIDIGAENKESAEKEVSIGDYAAFDSGFTHFGDGLIRAKAIDDRVGCAVLMTLIKDEYPCDITFAFTVQEEVGLRGAKVAAYRASPDIAIVIEGTTASDIPDVEGHKKVCELRRGAVIPFMDGATIYDRELFESITKTADENGIPWQTKRYISGGTDAGAIQRSGSGVKTAAISAPVRYLHSPNSVAAIEDIDAVLKIAGAFIKDPRF